MYQKKIHTFSIVAEPENIISDLVTQPMSAVEFIRSTTDKIDIITKEHFWILLLNQAKEILGKVLIGSGGISCVTVDSKIIFKHALDVLASGIILVHNHPSGNTKPSNTDIILTRKMSVAGLVLDIELIDHIIITEDSYFSFKEENILPNPNEYARSFFN